MKKLLFLILVLACPTAYAQRLIVKKDPLTNIEIRSSYMVVNSIVAPIRLTFIKEGKDSILRITFLGKITDTVGAGSKVYFRGDSSVFALPARRRAGAVRASMFYFSVNELNADYCLTEDDIKKLKSKALTFIRVELSNNQKRELPINSRDNQQIHKAVGLVFP